MELQKIKSSVRGIVPEFVIASRRRYKRYLRSKRDRRLPSSHVFYEIYKNNLWGGETGTFCSGEGSSLEANVIYCDRVKNFISDHNIKTVLDIGCGDFQVSSEIVGSHFNYIGIDVVEPLIEHNQKKFGNEHISFECLDVTLDELPAADLILIREVFQHLSNQQISTILERIKKVPYAIITEYQPSLEQLHEANIDKAHGMDTRIWDHSGIYLEHPPFSTYDVKIIMELPIEDYLVMPGERLVTYLLTHEQK